MSYATGSRSATLHVSQPVEAGVAVVVAQLVRHQVTVGRQVVVACPPDGPLARWVADAGARVEPWPATRSPGPSIAAETARLARIVHRVDPELVHLHSSKAGLAGRLAVRGRRPTVFQPHAWSFLATTGALYRPTLAWERRAARWTAAFACVGEDEQAEGERAGIDGRWFCCPNGVDLERFTPATEQARAAARHDLGLPTGPVVVCVGRLSRQKGQDVLIDSWAALTSCGRDAGGTLALVGDGPDREALTARAGSNVLFAGDVADVRPWYAAADLVVAASRWEGASLSVREAMAAGVSTVATDVAGNREIAGLATVPPDDVPAMVEAIAARLDDAQRRAAEGRAARAVAVARFGLPAAMRTYDAVYDAVLAGFD